MAALEKLFTADVANVSDGNGRHRVARKIIVGPVPVAKFLHAMVWFWEDVELEWVTTNGLATVVIRSDGLTFGMLTISATADGIDQVLWMLNTDKITDRSLPAGRAAETRFGNVTKPASTRS